jgi:predicted  nucleic acid-binding Zn-ribbon protein
MKSKLLTASLLASALFAGLGMSPAMAQGTNTPRIDQAQQAISDRIQQGLASGHITPSEAQALYRRDREISMRENQYKENGNATAQERAQLRSDLDHLASEVERLMANRDVVRPGAVGNAGNAGNTPGIDNREYQISQRIDEGIRSGQINQREARKLQRREREIARHEAQFKADGVVTPQERRQLRNELAALRNEVERMMNNDRRGGGRG